MKTDVFLTGALINQGAQQWAELNIAMEQIEDKTNFKVVAVNTIMDAMDETSKKDVTECMKLRGVYMLRNNIVVHLDNYELDPFAKAEVDFARAIGIPVLTVENILEKHSRVSNALKSNPDENKKD